jgi:hypothetical protein
MKHSVSLSLSLAAVMIVSGCGSQRDADLSTSELRQWIDKNVRVQFRRDALGAAASLPVPPTTGEISGAATCVVGKLMKVQGNGILIGPEERPKWIPREVILFVEANP